MSNCKKGMKHMQDLRISGPDWKPIQKVLVISKDAKIPTCLYENGLARFLMVQIPMMTKLLV